MDESGKVVLSRAQILGAVDLVIESVFVPEWGGTVYIRNLNGKGRDAFEGSRIKLDDQNKVKMVHDNTRARLVSLTLCDEHGALIFPDATDDEVQALGGKNASALDRLFDVAQRLSALRPQDVEQKVKNSVAVLSVNSSSHSPSL